MAEQVNVVFDEHRYRYGAIRISKELQSRGVKIGRHQTQTSMRIQNLKARQPKGQCDLFQNTDSSHNFGRNANVLLDIAPPLQPNEVFVGDITYIPMADGSFIYLATWRVAGAAGYVYRTADPVE